MNELAGWKLDEWPRAGAYRDTTKTHSASFTSDQQRFDYQVREFEDRRVAQLLWKLVRHARGINTGPCGEDPRARCATRDTCRSSLADFGDALDVDAGTLLLKLAERRASPLINRDEPAVPEVTGRTWANELLGTSFNHPADMFAVYKVVRELVPPESRSDLDRLFAGHGFFFDQDGNCLWNPGTNAQESQMRAAHDNNPTLETVITEPYRRFPEGDDRADITFGPAAGIQGFRMTVLYDPPYDDMSYVVESQVGRPGRIGVSLPERHYSARAYLVALRETEPAESMPLVLTTAEYWAAMESLPPDATSFRHHDFVFRVPSGVVTPGRPAIRVQPLGQAPDGVLVELTASFQDSEGRPLTYSWSAPGLQLQPPTARTTHLVLPAGDNLVSVHACNDTGRCGDASEVLDLDHDADGVMDAVDNCADVPNPQQEDADRDGRGDACDRCPRDPLDDADGDELCADADNCRCLQPRPGRRRRGRPRGRLRPGRGRRRRGGRIGQLRGPAEPDAARQRRRWPR